MANSTGGKIDWLYPELLSKEGLIEILSQRFVKLPEDTANTCVEDLLDLYYEYVIPRPQRKYSHNRRGRDMSKKQILQSKKRKITGPDNTSERPPPSKYMKTTAEPSRLLTSFEGHTSGDRLKPPPSCVNFDKKVIKLGGSSTSSESQSPSTTSSAPQTDDSSLSTTPRVLKLNRSSSGDANPDKSPTGTPQTMSLNKTIDLINSHLGGSGDAPIKKTQNCDGVEQPMETDHSPEPASEKKKFTKISWP